MIASLALFVIATTDKVVVAVVIIYIGITTCSLSNTYHSSKLLGSLQYLSLGHLKLTKCLYTGTDSSTAFQLLTSDQPLDNSSSPCSCCSQCPVSCLLQQSSQPFCSLRTLPYGAVMSRTKLLVSG